MKSQSIVYLLNGSEHTVYIGFWTLKVKCTQYEIPKMQGECFFRNWAGRAAVFGAQEFPGGLPCPDLTPPKVRRGCLMSPVMDSDIYVYVY